MNDERKNLGMTEGSIFRHILFFSIPILLGNIFQQLYNVADTAIIGNALGDDALAAVGATAAIYGLIIGFAGGMTNGFAVVLARHFGAGNHRKMKEAIAWIYILTVSLSIVFTSGCLAVQRPLLRFLNTPDEIINEASGYLTVIMSFTIITMLYNMFAGMLRAIGNSRTPLFFLMISSVSNITLDLLFVNVLKKGIAGAAVATGIAQMISVVLCFLYVRKKYPLLIPDFSYLKEGLSLVGDLLSTGFFMGIMYAIVSIGSVILQKGVNSFGKETITAHTVARKIDEMLMMPLSTLSITASTFVSQNYGAGKAERVKGGIKTAVTIAFGWSVCSCAIAYGVGAILIRTLSGTDSAYVIATASKYLRINVPFFPVLGILVILRSSLQGVGHKIVPVIGSFVELGGKILAVRVLVPKLAYIGICVLEPAVWIICAIIVFIDFLRFQMYFKRDRV